MPDPYLGKAVSSDDRDALGSRARYRPRRRGQPVSGRPVPLLLICTVVRVKASFQWLACSVGARPYLGRRSSACGARDVMVDRSSRGAPAAARCLSGSPMMVGSGAAAGAGFRLSTSRNRGDEERVLGHGFDRCWAQCVEKVVAASGDVACDRQRRSSVTEAAGFQRRLSGSSWNFGDGLHWLTVTR